MNNNLNIVTGGPGTGKKTTIIKGILYLSAYIDNLNVDSDKFKEKK
ncbi:MAG: hypothetical protein L6U99_14955 [Clostridium sp.]|nr:MAG: hypothetical protein L6U99_14955 [Clostridium sp.]